MRDIDADADETVWYQSLNVIIDLVVAKATKAKSSSIYARSRLSSRNNRKLCVAFGFSRIASFEQRKSKRVCVTYRNEGTLRPIILNFLRRSGEKRLFHVRRTYLV